MSRHGSVYVNTAAGIAEPADLRGRRVGTPEHQLSAGVWIRGILADNHGLGADEVTYVTGGQESPGRIETAGLRLPERFRVEGIGPDDTLSAMLTDGRIDALSTPRIPSPFVAGGPRVARLFPDTIATEKAFFAATGIIPIMHVVVIRRGVYERAPWVAQSLTKAFVRAKDDAAGRIYDSSALRFMLPWLNQQLEEARTTLGHDYWSYGLEPNRTALDTFLRYHFEQGLSHRRLSPDDLFVPESTESFLI